MLLHGWRVPDPQTFSWGVWRQPPHLPPMRIEVVLGDQPPLGGSNGRPLKPGGLHYINGSHHTGAWLILPLLSWWHTALSLFPTRWSNGSCTDLRLPGRHLGMDERTSPTAQLGKDWASCLPCHSNSTAWLPDSVRFINNYTINFVLEILV